MDWKKFAVDYFSFTRRDRIAVISLIVIICGISFLPAILFKNTNRLSPEEKHWAASAKKPEKQPGTEFDAGDFPNSANRPEKHRYVDNKRKIELFVFDPNSLSIADWRRLGLRDKTIRTIQNYLSKGGKFRKMEDLKRIYGLFEDEYERLAPFIKIESRKAKIENRSLAYSELPPGIPKSSQESYHDFENNSLNIRGYKKTDASHKSYSTVDINSADTTALIALPGIGSKLSQRIINFREKLGGFYSVDQVGETFGLADSTFKKIRQYLKVGNNAIRKININAVSLEELKMHPYIRYAIANAIINYRNEHGEFKKLEDLKNVMVVTGDVYRRVSHYINIE